jgi:hypothetical protein
VVKRCVVISCRHFFPHLSLFVIHNLPPIHVVERASLLKSTDIRSHVSVFHMMDRHYKLPIQAAVPLYSS